jgi:ankyrin repeat protein
MNLAKKDKDGHVPLTAAAVAGDASAVRRLLEAGADANARGQSGYTALAHAARQGHLEVVELLIEHGARVDARYSGTTALIRAAEGGHLDCVRALVAAGADISFTNKAGNTAVGRAYASNRPEMVLYLLEVGAPMGVGFPGTKAQLVTWARTEIEAGRCGRP